MRILVTGGAGYIGSIMTRTLLDQKHEVVVVDSLEKGYENAVDSRAIFLKGNLQDHAFMENMFANHSIDAVFHFAAYISVAESMQTPEKYFQNNIFSVLALLEAMQKNGVKRFIFSSTAAVYGNPQHETITEEHEKHPTSVYGESKLMAEKILQWYNKLYDMQYVILRYFNASGATLDSSLGERHVPESHIIPNAILAALNNASFTLYGTSYPTPDGTCVRDYIHVLDLAQSHILALERISKGSGSSVYNVGTGKGYSNREVVEMVKYISGIDFPVEEVAARPGDSPILVADPAKIQNELGFIPKYSDLKTIVETAWKWHKKLKDEK